MDKKSIEKFNGYRQGKTLKGTKTEQNILKSFAGESQARNRYTMFAELAKEEGYEQIADLFYETAHNEQIHAEIFFSFLQGDGLEITAAYPAGKVSVTLDNLKAAAEGEHEEHSAIYPAFADEADREGFPRIANQFRLIANIEKEHEERFRKLAKNIETDLVFKKEDKVVWICRECGHIHVGDKAPAVCPNCLKPQAYFEVKATNY